MRSWSPEEAPGGDNFYSDRSKPCPFFVRHPDESLAQYVEDGLIEPGRAIDLGCGNGRSSIFLAQHGFSVEAVDYSRAAIEWARELAEEAGVSISLKPASVFDLDLQ